MNPPETRFFPTRRALRIRFSLSSSVLRFEPTPVCRILILLLSLLALMMPSGIQGANGSYIGTYSGGRSGTWHMVFVGGGVTEVSIQEPSGFQVDGSGYVAGKSIVMAFIKATTALNFSGVIDVSGSVSGTWSGFVG